MATKKENRRLRIRRNIRSKVSGTSDRPRLAVFRSNTTIYAQLIDDSQGKTIASASSKEIESSKNATIQIAKTVGQKLAEKAKSSGISSVTFDRGGYLYHGKIKALAEGAREGGLNF
jgi:large subunit ribosomal protein L18